MVRSFFRLSYAFYRGLCEPVVTLLLQPHSGNELRYHRSRASTQKSKCPALAIDQ